MESKRLEDELVDLYLVMNGPIKGILSNWHDVMFKVKVAKMGHITLTDNDLKTIITALDPLMSCIRDVYRHACDRRT